ncbi:MAG: hypothetical protein A2445_01750 [Candidatus Jacksonbacteria bacterium RIFOXYC2_FULL_44_29]|nr:MAG: ATP synthase, subunit C [Parcubacteria group bacterium GW2011_GWC2_44_22]OGY75581.1 MAG: hypothetical protein A2295_05175 [Candidatus Jacksonbacteria bacterium RIFOXYB2_FULL_44_15]OGY75675.1 MAG: hypothetical protein A2240_03950 [Candidatus Jacksonbacteria bacterium RIFOXYA2_FULL_43_12]OGY77569.1 MAG: hypothetical protein A2445_01750 [Candidatus Jacksonbacteria bacterium RIFOXYC2_FULL_44_29]OGY81759.1 MAG: hypothetical protein A2550_01150 [Candidatus Jacksonbacteria bacterium RIFOXYD2_F
MYEYLSGLIRVLEKQLPDKTTIDRLSLAKSATDAFSVLYDTGYANNLVERSPIDYQTILNDDFLEVKKLYQQNIGSRPLFAFFFIDFDFTNIKIILKQTLLDTNLNQPLNEFGLFDPKKLYDNIKLKHEIAKSRQELKNTNTTILDSGKLLERIALLTQQLKKFPLNDNLGFSLKHILSRVVSEEKNLNSPALDTIVDLELWRLKTKLAKKIKHRFITDLVKLQIDFQNTKMLLRLTAEKGNQNFNLSKDIFIHGGRTGPNKLLAMFAMDKPVLFSNLKEISEWYKIEHILEEFRAKKKLWGLEKELNAYELEFATSAAKSEPAGPAVIAGYFFAKQNAMRNLRLIFSGKLNGINNEAIRERLIV